jgi:hypothetical protein
MKILDSDFRKELYKNLVEAGYEKQEAQKIVGVKYYNALKDKMLTLLSSLSSDINGNQFNPLSEDFINVYNADIAELQKMSEYLNN